MMSFNKFYNPKWYLFVGDEFIHNSKVFKNENEISWINKGQYFEAIENKNIFIITSVGNTLFKKKDKIKIEKPMLEEYESEDEVSKESELVFTKYPDPEGKDFYTMQKVPIGSKFNS